MEELTMLPDTMKRLFVEEDGMEMVEWAIVGVVFAVAAAAFWTRLSGEINTSLGDIENAVAGNVTAPTG
jgi:Flp pilus assembly pilin Flp